MSGPPTRQAWLRGATARLAAAGVEAPQREARLLLRWACGLDAASLATALDTPLGPAEAARLETGLARRAARVPLSHITGQRAFWQHSFTVTPDVLDPRPETELLVALALEGPPARCIADIGTGSGCILLTLLAAWPAARGVGVDISPAALAVAASNADRLGVGARVAWRQGDLLAPVAGPVDLLVSNPPYLATGELADVSPEVAAEPRLALDGGPDGLAAYRAMATSMPQRLAPGARVLLEIGPTQGDAVAGLLASAGLASVAIHRDLDERPRVVAAKMPDFV